MHRLTGTQVDNYLSMSRASLELKNTSVNSNEKVIPEEKK
jgi:hypothetical protein